MLKKVNAYRHAHGVGKVRLSSSLAASAKRYSRHMMRHGYFGHASRIHASRRFRTLGEIIEIHRGGAGVRTAFRAWVHSPPHRSVMLMRTF
ncbi:MAG: Cysteine-rich secretory protein family, partial [Thermoleophilaceae bacterium]|nr:Cysteine-rich secretory protein family [Thermoleophilaceae bacterium]